MKRLWVVLFAVAVAMLIGSTEINAEEIKLKCGQGRDDGRYRQIVVDTAQKKVWPFLDGKKGKQYVTVPSTDKHIWFARSSGGNSYIGALRADGSLQTWALSAVDIYTDTRKPYSYSQYWCMTKERLWSK